MTGKTSSTAALLAAAAALFFFCVACSGQPPNARAAGETRAEKETQNAADPSFGPAAPGPRAGQKAPSFRLPELASGQAVNFPEDFSGKKVALLFFSPG
jgi:hypothetical protein